LNRRTRRIGLFLLAAGTVGALTGLLLKHQVVLHRRELFSSNPFRRLAALRHMAGEPATVDAITVLRDFAAWEPRRLLRTRAASVVARMQRELRRRAGKAARGQDPTGRPRPRTAR